MNTMDFYKPLKKLNTCTNVKRKPEKSAIKCETLLGQQFLQKRWNPLGATERLGATTVTSWSGQTRGGWAMVPAQGPLVDGGRYEGWLVDCASTGTPRFVEEDDVRFLCEARDGWALVPTQGPLGNKSSKWFRVFLLQPPSRSDPECRFTK
jgi:hypothetical protein